jgi:hypothetical protein
MALMEKEQYDSCAPHARASRTAHSSAAGQQRGGAARARGASARRVDALARAAASWQRGDCGGVSAASQLHAGRHAGRHASGVAGARA